MDVGVALEKGGRGDDGFWRLLKRRAAVCYQPRRRGVCPRRPFALFLRGGAQQSLQGRLSLLVDRSSLQRLAPRQEIGVSWRLARPKNYLLNTQDGSVCCVVVSEGSG